MYDYQVEDSRDMADDQSDQETKSDLDLEEQQEMEIALYSQLHFDVNDSIENDGEKDYNIHVSHQHEKIAKPMISDNYLSHSSNMSVNLKTGNDQFNTENKSKLSRYCSSQDEGEKVNKISDMENQFKVLDSDHNMSDLSDNSDTEQFELDSDVMILDEYISDMDDIKVHVDDGQKKMLKRLTQKQTEEEIKDAKKWAILDKDRYSSSDLKNRYYKTISVRCNNCKDIGHLSKDCPKPQKNNICYLCGFTGHNHRTCPNGICYNCDQIGHISYECQNPRRNRYIECHRCSMLGHSQSECPDIWRQYHMTTIPGTLRQTDNKENSRMFCCNCASKRHFGFNCPKGRMDKHNQPTYPFVAVYRQNKYWEKDRPLKRKRGYNDNEDEQKEHRNKKAKHDDSKSKKLSSFATRIKDKIKSKLSNKSEKESDNPSTSKEKCNKRKKEKKLKNKSSDNVGAESVAKGSSTSSLVINKDKNNRTTVTLQRETEEEEFKHQAFNNHYWEKKQGKKKKPKKKKNKKGDSNTQYARGSSDRNANSRIVQKTSRGFQISVNTQKTQLVFKR